MRRAAYDAEMARLKPLVEAGDRAALIASLELWRAEYAPPAAYWAIDETIRILKLRAGEPLD
jgi:hypothetical protein